MKFTDEELREAAVQAEKYLLAQLPPEDACGHEFSPEFEERMAVLINDVKHNKIKQRHARLGWQLYTRNSLAAALLCFALAFLTMPEAVIANCQKVIEAVETVFNEYTEYRYTSNASSETEFHPLVLGYLPEGMEEVEDAREETTGMIYSLYTDKENVRTLAIRQYLVTEKLKQAAYKVDSENVQIETILIQNDEIQLLTKKGKFDFYWTHGAYHISGQTNVSREELLSILEKIEFPQE